MRIQGLKSTKDKPPDTHLEDKSKTNVTVDPSTTKEGKVYSYLSGRLLTTSSKYIYTSKSSIYMIVIPS